MQEHADGRMRETELVGDDLVVVAEVRLRHDLMLPLAEILTRRARRWLVLDGDDEALAIRLELVDERPARFDKRPPALRGGFCIDLLRTRCVEGEGREP